MSMQIAYNKIGIKGFRFYRGREDLKYDDVIVALKTISENGMFA